MSETASPIQLLDNLKKAELTITGTLVKEPFTIGKLTQLNPGSVLMFNKPMNNQASLCVNGQAIATGAVVKVNERFGVEIKEIHSSAPSPAKNSAEEASS